MSLGEISPRNKSGTGPALKPHLNKVDNIEDGRGTSLLDHPQSFYISFSCVSLPHRFGTRPKKLSGAAAPRSTTFCGRNTYLARSIDLYEFYLPKRSGLVFCLGTFLRPIYDHRAFSYPCQRPLSANLSSKCLPRAPQPPSNPSDYNPSHG